MCVEVHGGIGYTWEYDIHVWVRRALHDQAFLCDGRLLRELIAADNQWGDPEAAAGLHALLDPIQS